MLIIHNAALLRYEKFASTPSWWIPTGTAVHIKFLEFGGKNLPRQPISSVVQGLYELYFNFARHDSVLAPMAAHRSGVSS